MIIYVVDSYVYDGELELCREISNHVRRKPSVGRSRTARRIRIGRETRQASEELLYNAHRDLFRMRLRG